MAFLDLGSFIKIEHETLKNDHVEATTATTKLHMQADEVEASGDHQSAADLRAVATEIQVSANKRWFRSN